LPRRHPTAADLRAVFHAPGDACMYEIVSDDIAFDLGGLPLEIGVRISTRIPSSPRVRRRGKSGHVHARFHREVLHCGGCVVSPKRW
jgi:hypothetical protein